MSKPYTLAIVGGGILGVASAWTYQARHPEASVILIERGPALSMHQTGRNSGVIHAGVYYAPGSLKAQFCKRGAVMTKTLAQAMGVPFEICGKLIVASDDAEVPAMRAIAERAAKNDISLRMISGDALADLEPDIAGVAALVSPDSGIVDYAALCAAIAKRFEAAGGAIRLNCALHDIIEERDSVRLITDGAEIVAEHVLACAGAQADRVAAMSGLSDGFQIVPFRGEYYEVKPSWTGSVNHLIYPVPDPALPFLGIHLTRMIGGRLTVGPNAMLSFGRENYAANIPDMADLVQSLGFAGFWKLMMRNRRSAAYELAGSLSKQIYLKRCQRYCPSLSASDLGAWPTGIRAQAVGSDGKMIDDFLIRETRRSTHICNAPSPAATSAMPIAEHICARIEMRAQADHAAILNPDAAAAADQLMSA